MASPSLAQFEGEKYLSLETFKKSGQGVPTPVWFVLANGAFYAYTEAGSWKVKRIRNNPRVRIAPCDMRGNVTGEWVDAAARPLDAANAKRADDLLNRKYGLMKRILNFLAKLRGHERASFAIELD